MEALQPIIVLNNYSPIELNCTIEEAFAFDLWNNPDPRLHYRIYFALCNLDFEFSHFRTDLGRRYMLLYNLGLLYWKANGATLECMLAGSSACRMWAQTHLNAAGNELLSKIEKNWSKNGSHIESIINIGNFHIYYFKCEHDVLITHYVLADAIYIICKEIYPQGSIGWTQAIML